MPDVYTRDWSNAIQELLNGNAEVEKNAPRGRYKMLAEIHGDRPSPYVAEGEQRFFVVQFDEGKCTDYDELDEAPPRKDFDFIFEFPASVFEGVAAATVDPIDAGLKGTIKITGDMRILIRHAELVNVLRDVYAREVETTWPKGEPPYAS